MHEGLFAMLSIPSRAVQRCCYTAFCLILLVSLAAGPPSAASGAVGTAKAVQASQWYVAPNGSDLSDCRSPTQPCATIGAAVARGTTGDTIAVAAGTYAENLILSKDLTILGAGRDSTIIDGGGTNRVVYIQPGAKVTLADLTVRNGAIRLDWAFRTTAAQPPARVAHTTTAIYEGILVAGGTPTTNPSQPMADTWIYDSTINSWRQVATMHTPRSGHIGIRLNDGSVVVAGGFGLGGVPLTSVERYYPDNPYIPDDPPEGRWVEMAPLPEAHAIGTAVLLHTHEMMVIGGLGPAGNAAPLNSAAIYNPTDNTWRSAAPLPSGRWRHTMTLLDDGTVLVAGGTTNNGVTWLNEALRYDPRANTWTPTATPMTTPRIYHAAALLHDGRVLVAGGPGLKSAELFEPATNRWTRAADMAAPRWLHSLTTMFNGDILVAGGFDEALAAQGGSGVVAGAEIYHPETNTWRSAGTLLTPRFEHTAVRYNRGEILFVGGRGEANDGATGLAEIEHYAPSSFRHTDNGAGVYVDSGAELTLFDSIVRDNHSDQGGGGIDNRGTLRLERSEVRENEAAVYPGGAGILNDEGIVELKDSRVVANYSAGGSVGIASGNGAITLDNSRVENNILYGRDSCCAVGGGIAVTNGRLTLINNSEVSGNRVTGGPGQSHSAGIFIGGSNGILTMRNSRVRDNHVLVTSGFSAIGGGIYLDQGGGASTGYLIDSEVSGNTVVNLSGQQSAGAGIVVDESILVMTRTLVLDNQTFGGHGGSAGLANIGGTMNVYDSAIIGNRAGVDAAFADAGGVYNGGTALISGTLISGNSASSSGGGLLNSGTLVINGGAISENTATAHGGGINNGTGSTLTLNGVTLNRNSAAYDGGGIFNNGTLTLSQSTVSQNALTATDRPSSGGGIMNGTDAQLTLNASAVISNTVAGMPTSDGGGSGGGISGGNVLIQNSTISGNQAPRGGGIYNVNELTLLNSTVASNIATHQTGGIYARTGGGDTIVISNTLVAGNIDQLADDGLHPDCSGVFPSHGHNLIGAVNPAACTFNATASDQVGTLATPLDPRLGPLAANGGPTPNHALLPGSPAIDAAGATCPPTDQRGVSRPGFGSCDIGAFEAAYNVHESGLALDTDVWKPHNVPGQLGEYGDDFFKIFGQPSITRIITATETGPITATDTVELPFSLGAEDIEAALPISISVPISGTVIPNLNALMYYTTVVSATFADANVQWAGSTLNAGLCVGMTSTVVDFKAGGLHPSSYGGASVGELTLTEDVRSLLQQYHLRQMSAEALIHLAGPGRQDNIKRYIDDLAARIGTPRWWQNPEIIGIVNHEGEPDQRCDDAQTGHALLPYRTVHDESLQLYRIYVYDPNYPPNPLSNAEDHYIDIFRDATSGIWRWRYEIESPAAGRPGLVWSGRTLYSLPLDVLRHRDGSQLTLPTEDDNGVLLVNGGQASAWGGKKGAWGGRSGAWGELGDGQVIGCIVSENGEFFFTREISRSLHLFSLNGPALYIPRSEIDRTGALTFTSQGGEVSDMLIFGRHVVIGYLGTANDQTQDQLTVDPSFQSTTLRTSDQQADKQVTIYQMHEGEPDEQGISETRVVAVSNADLGAGEALTMHVTKDSQGNVTAVDLINTSGEAKRADIGFANIGGNGISSVVFVQQPIEPGARRTYTPGDWQHLGSTPITVEIDTNNDGHPEREELLQMFPAPSSRVLDSFNRPNGTLGANWSGRTDPDEYRISQQRVRVYDGGVLYWRPEQLGTAQEAFVTFTHIDQGDSLASLLLKVQGATPNVRNGAIEVRYDAEDREVEIRVRRPNQAWQRIATIPTRFRDGDQLGARVLRDGTVLAYRNGTLVATANAGGFFANRGGFIGLRFTDADSATFDDFGGGTLNP